MSLGTWANEKVRKMDWTDISLIKISTAGFVLFVAKLWEPILSLEWYWYLVISLLAAIKPVYNCYLK